jgi:sugar lactone lactonase YvrE
MAASRLNSINPLCAIEGGRVSILGSDFPIDQPRLPEVRIGELRARVVYASPSRIAALVPPGITESGRVPVRIVGVEGNGAYVEVGATFATGLHQVDSPVFDRDGNLYVTYSGTRGLQVPVSIFRVRPNGTRETFSSGIINPTSIAIDPDNEIYVSSRFEGIVYRVSREGEVRPFATDLGVACGLVFAPDGTLYVGDRSGTVFRVDRRGKAEAFATLPPSVAAFHLALGPDSALYVTGPTLSPYDAVYRVDADGHVTVRSQAFGRPQGLAFDRSGTLFIVEALAGSSGVYRLPESGEPELVVSAPGLVGLAFDGHGSLIVCSNDSAYRLAGRSSQS